MQTVDDLLMLPSDEIDFSALDDGMLSELATQTQDPFIATSALGELAQREAPQTRAAAIAILESSWDRHLTAYATTILYGVDREDSIRRMTLMLGSCDDPKVLGAMIENVLSDRERFERDDGRTLVARLADRVRMIPAADFSDAEERAQFLERYAPADPDPRD